MGGLQRGSEGPLPRIFLCGCSFGLAQVTEGGVQEKPLDRGVTHFDLSSPGARPHKSGFVTRLLPHPLPPDALELGLTVWAAAAALLARRGGKAMGEGGPVPTPLRGGPTPSPGEA